MSKILKKFLETILHSDLGGVQGGAEGEHYHLTRAEWERTPVTPYIASPADGAVNVNQVPLIQGCEYRHPYNVMMNGRHLQIASDEAFENIVYEAQDYEESVSFQILLKDDETPYFEPGTTYYARIRYQARDEKWSQWSPVSRFSTMAEFPDSVLIAPRMVLPPDGGVAAANNPILAMTQAQTMAGVTNFVKADWQIANNPEFTPPLLYEASQVDTLTLHQADGVNLASAVGAEFYARGRQKAITGEWTGWSPAVRFRLKENYTDLVFGIRKVFSKKNNVPLVYNIDTEGNQVSITKKYWDNHPMYQFPVSEEPVGDTGLTSSLALVPPCWMKHRVYDNDNGDMVIDTWYSPTPQEGDGWRLDMAFENSPNGFLHGTCMPYLSAQNIYVSKYGTAGKDAYANYMGTYLDNTKSAGYHLWTIYERRLLLDLLMAEYRTLYLSLISTLSGVENNDSSFKWRAFRCLMATDSHGSGTCVYGLSNSANAGLIDKISVMTPNGGAWIPFDTALPIGANMYVTNILRGYSDELGFDVALLGVCSSAEANSGQTSNPYGVSANLTMQKQFSSYAYCTYLNWGLFAMGANDATANAVNRYVRITKDVE